MKIEMTKVDPEQNMDRFYNLELTTDLFGRFGVERMWGRSGVWVRSKLEWFEEKSAAIDSIHLTTSNKVQRGYQQHAECSLLLPPIARA